MRQCGKFVQTRLHDECADNREDVSLLAHFSTILFQLLLFIVLAFA
jgi:hypothetical protein